MPTPVSPPAGRPALAHPAYELFAAALSLLAIVNVVLYLLIPDPALDTILAVMNGLFSVIFRLDFLSEPVMRVVRHLLRARLRVGREPARYPKNRTPRRPATPTAPVGCSSCSPSRRPW